MEAVKAFNDELFSIQEGRGPLSKAKMTKITSIAIKAVKFYKHVVHGVEKFIQRSSTEHKIPGLYVMDAIIRQSLHKFGPDKDVFAARFSKNIFNTFENLLQCKKDEKVKIVRVLQLWQKNAAFSNELIQKLIEQIGKSSEARSDDRNVVDMSLASTEEESAKETSSKQLDSSRILNDVCQMLQSDKAVQINQLLQQVASNHPQLLPQLSQIIQLSQSQSSSSTQQNQSEGQTARKPFELESNFQATESSSKDANRAREEEGRCSKEGKHQRWLTECAMMTQQSIPEASDSHVDFQSGQSQSAEGGDVWVEEDSYWSRKECFNSSQQWSDNENRSFRKRRRSDDRGSDERSQRSRSPVREKRRRSRERSYGSSSRDRYEGKHKKHSDHPDVKPDHVLISSTTMWIGHLNKHTTEGELKTELSKYGTVTSINLIPPRGCAFVTFSTRRETWKAIDKMKDMKLNTYVVKVAWAIGSGMRKSELEKFWDIKRGVSHIPWDGLDDSMDLDALAEGGYLHEESLPQGLLKALTERRQSIPAEQPQVDPQEASSTSGSIDNNKVMAAPTVIPPCFTRFPPPLPGMPPMLPPGLLMGMPPPLISSGVPTPIAMMSPSQGNQSEASTPSNSSKPHSDLPFVTPPFPPPPMSPWNPPAVMMPLTFPPPTLPLMPQQPQNFETESKTIENNNEVVESEFDQGQAFYGGHGKSWGYNNNNNNRGGYRGSHRNNYNNRDDDSYNEADGGRQFTPHKFGQRYNRHDHHHHHQQQHHHHHNYNYRGKSNWNNNNNRNNDYKQNYRQNWVEDTTEYEEEQTEEYYQEDEGTYNQQGNNGGWGGNYQRHQQRWNNKRDNKWGNEDHDGKGYHNNRGGQQRWGQQRDNNNRWNNNNNTTNNNYNTHNRTQTQQQQTSQWEDQRNYYQHNRMPHHEGIDLKSIEERYQVRGREKGEDGSNWEETTDETKASNERSTTTAEEEESKEEEVKKRLKKSRWDDDNDDDGDDDNDNDDACAVQQEQVTDESNYN